MSEEFKRIKRELVAKGHIFDYYHDTMQIPNGNIAVWDFIEHKGAAAVVPVREDGKLLLVRQYRNALPFAMKRSIFMWRGSLSRGSSISTRTNISTWRRIP